jgi:hypothetical protein
MRFPCRTNIRGHFDAVDERSGVSTRWPSASSRDGRGPFQEIGRTVTLQKKARTVCAKGALPAQPEKA